MNDRYTVPLEMAEVLKDFKAVLAVTGRLALFEATVGLARLG